MATADELEESEPPRKRSRRPPPPKQFAARKRVIRQETVLSNSDEDADMDDAKDNEDDEMSEADPVNPHEARKMAQDEEYVPQQQSPRRSKARRASRKPSTFNFLHDDFTTITATRLSKKARKESMYFRDRFNVIFQCCAGRSKIYQKASRLGQLGGTNVP